MTARIFKNIPPLVLFIVLGIGGAEAQDRFNGFRSTPQFEPLKDLAPELSEKERQTPGDFLEMGKILKIGVSVEMFNDIAASLFSKKTREHDTGWTTGSRIEVDWIGEKGQIEAYYNTDLYTKEVESGEDQFKTQFLDDMKLGVRFRNRPEKSGTVYEMGASVRALTNRETWAGSWIQQKIGHEYLGLGEAKDYEAGDLFKVNGGIDFNTGYLFQSEKGQIFCRAMIGGEITTDRKQSFACQFVDAGWRPFLAKNGDPILEIAVSAICKEYFNGEISNSVSGELRGCIFPTSRFPVHWAAGITKPFQQADEALHGMVDDDPIGYLFFSIGGG